MNSLQKFPTNMSFEAEIEAPEPTLLQLANEGFFDAHATPEAEKKVYKLPDNKLMFVCKHGLVLIYSLTDGQHLKTLGTIGVERPTENMFRFSRPPRPESQYVKLDDQYSPKPLAERRREINIIKRSPDGHYQYQESETTSVVLCAPRQRPAVKLEDDPVKREED